VAVLLTVAKGSPTVLLRFEVNRGDLLVLASQAAWVVYFTRSTAARRVHSTPGLDHGRRASRTATVLNLMPFVVLALSWALLGERLHAYHVAGATLMVAGVYLATRPT